jgi:uncharacterized protein (TIGR02001 family)
MKSTNWLLNRHVLGALCATSLLLGSASVFADEAAPAVEAAPAAAEAAAPAEPAPPYTLTYNLGLFSNYIARGVNNSSGIALQGGIDWAHSSGFYLGAWFSSTNPYNLGGAGSVTNVDASGNPLGKGNHYETDWYGGYAYTFENGLGVSVGGNYVWYPEGRKSYHNNNQDTFEGSLGVSYKYFSYTFYHAFTDWYGIGVTRPAGLATAVSAKESTKGAEYHELKFNYPLPFGGLNLASKLGYQRSSDICLNQKDYLIGINKSFAIPTAGKPLDGFTAGANYTNTFGEETCSVQGFYYTDDNGLDTNSRRVTFFIKRSW